MNREIKFRAWDPQKNAWYCMEIFRGGAIGPIHSEKEPFIYEMGFPVGPHIILEQYTGLKDKNGTEIYEGDTIRVKGKMGNEQEYSFDAIYQVVPLDHEGVSLRFLELVDKETEGPRNQIPIHQTASFRYRSLGTRDANRLVFESTWGENPNHRTRWAQHHFTDEVEVIGNIHDTDKEK